MRRYHHFLFATDMSCANQRIFEKISDLALLHRARLSVVHVVDEAMDDPFYAIDGQKMINDSEFLAKNKLSLFCKPLKVPKPDQFVSLGDPIEIILQTTQKVGADLLIVGKNGSGKMAKNLLSILPCELLVLPSRDKVITSH